MQLPSPSSYTAKGFLRSLFDVNFSSLIVTRVIKVLYVIAIIIVGLEALGIFVAALASKRASDIVLAVIFIPIVSLLSLIWIRILLELVIIIFRIGEDVRRISLSASLTDAPGQGSVGTEASISNRSGTADGRVTTEDMSSNLSTTESAQVSHASLVTPTSTDVAGASSSSTHTDPTTQRDLPVAGWYDDPQNEGYWRLWDGQRWTEQRRPANPQT